MHNIGQRMMSKAKPSEARVNSTLNEPWTVRSINFLYYTTFKYII